MLFLKGKKWAGISERKNIWEYDVLDGETFGEYEYAPDLPALRALLLR